MMELNISICDDSAEQVESLKRYLKTYGDAKQIRFNITTSYDGSELIEKLKGGSKFDIYLMDVEMDDMDGMECGKILREEYDASILIYITGFKKYAFDAFGVKAFDYILKPISYKRFEDVLGNAIKTFKEVEDIKKKEFVLKTKKTLLTINYHDIYYFEKYLRKIKVVFRGGEEEFYSSFKELTEMLDMDYFTRCHQSYFINNNKITYYKQQEIYIEDIDFSIPVSKANIKSVKNALAQQLL